MQTFHISEILVILSTVYPSIVPHIVRPVLLPFGDGNAAAIHITPIFLVGTLLVCVGCLIRISCYKTLGRFFTFELTLRTNHTLITDGLYSYVRHPSYTGAYMYVLGLLMCEFGSGSWMLECGLLRTNFGMSFVVLWFVLVGIFLVSMVVRTYTEDGTLKKQFGKEWVSWAERTPYKLFPLVF